MKKVLYHIIEDDYNVKICVAEEELKASIACSDDAALLEIFEGLLVLSLIHTKHSEKNSIVEFTLSVACAD